MINASQSWMVGGAPVTEFIKLPSGDWINPAHISHAQWGKGTGALCVWTPGFALYREYYDDDAIALAAALDAMSIKEDV